MKIFYDLHIHSALSPCGDNDMTPNNIVNMSLIKGLNTIAVTDHNSCGNVGAVMEAARGKICVVPGMEVETCEEVHMTCYFPTLEQLKEMETVVRKGFTGIKNRPEIFGEQLFMDENDEIIGHEEELLVAATSLTVYDVFDAAKYLGGAAVFAHIDRSSYSVISNLGFLPPDLPVTTVEITEKNLNKLRDDYSKYNIITNSDAHYLENIAEPERYIDIKANNPNEIIKYLCKIN